MRVVFLVALVMVFAVVLLAQERPEAPQLLEASALDIILAINGEDSYCRAMTVSHGRFGGFLLHRSALQRPISTGFTSGQARPKVHVSGLPRNHDQTTRKASLISPD